MILFITDFFKHIYLKLTGKRIDYQLYLKTEHWKKVRYKTIKRFDYKCCVCSSRKDLEIHHNSYKNLYWEHRSEVVCLCKACHRTFHYYRWNNGNKAS